MAEHDDGNPSPEADAMITKARDLFLAALDKHDEEAHGGRFCLVERAGALAYLAHCMGLRPAILPVVAQMMADLASDELPIHPALMQRKPDIV
jgi:hypothetical protein